MSSKFVKQDKPDTGKKFEQVTKMLDILSKSDEVIPFERLCVQVGAKYPQDVQAAMYSLELTGLVDRYTYVEDGSTRPRIAYKWTAQEKNGNRPTRAASSGSKKQSSRSSSAQKAKKGAATAK